MEQVQHAQQLADVPAGQYDDHGLTQRAVNLCAVRGDPGVLLGSPGVPERRLQLGYPRQVLRVEQPHGLDGVTQGPFAQSGPRVAAVRYVVGRGERVVELNEIQVPELGQGGVMRSFGGGELTVRVEDLEPPGAQAQVDYRVRLRAADQLAEFLVVVLSFLPSRRDDGGGTVEVKSPDSVLHGGPALRAEHRDGMVHRLAAICSRGPGRSGRRHTAWP